MKYKTNIIFDEVDWRYYLDSSTNHRVDRFLELTGEEVLNQLYTNIRNSIMKKKSTLEILLHPNVSSVTIINESEFEEVLDFCLKWFMENEHYEMCSEIMKTQDILKDKKEKTIINKEK